MFSTRQIIYAVVGTAALSFMAASNDVTFGDSVFWYLYCPAAAALGLIIYYLCK